MPSKSTSLDDALAIADSAGIKDATVVCASRAPDLAPCPFCGDGGEWHEHASRLSPTMRGPGAVVSVALCAIGASGKMVVSPATTRCAGATGRRLWRSGISGR